MLERRFRRDLGSLEPMFDFVAEFFASNGIDPSHAFEVDLVIEELFTNMLKYSKGGAGEVAIGLRHNDARLVITLRDFDVEAYDVTQTRPVDTALPMERRRPGGLWLHFVRRVSESIVYEYKDRSSTITVTKRLES